MVGYRKVECFLLVCCVLFCVAVGDVTGQPVDVAEGARADSQLKLEEKTKKAKKKRAGSKISREEVAELNFPEDTSSVMIAKELRITGNTLVTTEELLAKIPFAYNASEVSLQD